MKRSVRETVRIALLHTYGSTYEKNFAQIFHTTGFTFTFDAD